jgi:predicted amidohydrolase
MKNEFKIAAIQASPVFYDRDASTEKACQLIADAGARGIELAAFGETWLPGYPFHASLPEHNDLWFETASDYLEQAVLVPSETTDRLCDAARKAGIDVVIGIVELDPATLGTVYCTLLFIGKEGVILGKHRKLKPTVEERIVWGQGDGTDLDVYQRSYGRISGLNCWEHQMLLPGYALIAQGTQIHIASWPGKEPAQVPAAPYAMWPRQILLSRAFASQAACYVIAAAGMMRMEDIQAKHRPLATYEYTGDSAIIDPRGEIIAGPVSGEETILEATVSLDLVRAAKSLNDCAGHYARPDVFTLLVNGKPVPGPSVGAQGSHSGDSLPEMDE